MYSQHYTALVLTLGHHPDTKIRARFDKRPTPADVRLCIEHEYLADPSRLEPLVHYKIRVWRVRTILWRWHRRRKLDDLRLDLVVSNDGNLLQFS